MSNEKKLTGVDKAAILLMHLGEDLAGEVARHMSPNEMQAIGGSIVQRESISSYLSGQVAGEFLEIMEDGDVSVEGVEFAKNLITKVLDPESAQFVLDQITRDTSGGGIDSLKWMDPGLVANIIKNEHPQIVALILTHLDPEKASQVLLCLPDERMRGEVMLRVATLKRIPQAAVKDLEVLIKEQLLNTNSNLGNTVEGVKVAAEILNQVESNAESVIMDAIEKSSPDLAVKIQEKMFVFSDLLGIDDRGMQQIIKELSTDVLTIALKGAEEQLQEKFLKNMSERAAEMLKDDMEAKGPVRLSDVEKAQQEIVKVARRLEQEGKIVRAGRGGEVLV